MNERRIQRALISVSDKTGIIEFAAALQRWNIELISTGGTLKVLHEAGIQACSVSDVTGFPEILDGRVKTLHPLIHAGLLGVIGNPSHEQQLREFHVTPIDMVVVNLYPFEATVAKTGVIVDEAVEQIDIGGPAMLRSASKNFASKTVIVDANEYTRVISEMEVHNGSISEETRLYLAKQAFYHTARYDSQIANYFSSLCHVQDALPDTFSISLKKGFDVRYGENPHQQAALYGSFTELFQQLHGKELSFNNIVDIQAASDLTDEFDEPTVAIIKHTNPCGVGSGTTAADAYLKALATDRTSAFGGIVSLNRPLDLNTAELIDTIFTEVVIAPGYEDDALLFLKKKKDRRIILKKDENRRKTHFDIRSVGSSLLVQTANRLLLHSGQLRVVTKRIPIAEEYAALLFAWRVAKHVKSNAIVYAGKDRTVGIGAGQMSRIDSSRIAVIKANDAGLPLEGTAVASDAFFPFADGLIEAIRAGATAVIQPGGSIRDEEVIRAADEHGIAMVFTDIRHFKH